jgi:hypothetical protein
MVNQNSDTIFLVVALLVVLSLKESGQLLGEEIKEMDESDDLVAADNLQRHALK